MVPIGTRLGPHEITGSLGAGAMGEVYRARDTRLKREVALKILPDRFAADPERLIRFQREAEALAALNHPNIAAIYGLEAAHARGIVHRDLKPANIKCSVGHQVNVLDFGLAKMTARSDAGSPPNAAASTNDGLSSGGAILGTVGYMSPEQARGLAVDARTDIWAYGCILFEMLTGRVAFAGATAADTIGAIIRSEPDWTALPADTPTAIRRLLRRSLSKDPSERLHDVADARLEIEDARLRPAIDAAAPSAGSARPSRVPTLVAAASVALAAAAAVPAVRHLREGAIPPSVQAPVMRLQVVTPPTTDPLSFAISPDGLRLTFVGTSDGVPRLWLRPLDEMTAQPMPGTDGATYPFWSPDSQSIAFFAAGKLKRIDIGGGQPQDLADVSGSRGGTWNRNGVILYALGASGLRRVSSSGGESTAATQLGKDQTNHRFPVFLPDGRRYLYFTQGSNQAQGVYLGTLDSAESTRLTAADSVAAYLEPGFLLYMRQGTLVARRLEPSGSLASDQSVIADGVGLDGSIGNAAFSTSSSGVIAYRVGGPGRRQFVWFARAGRQTGVVTPPDANNLQYPTISKDGRRLASDRTVLNNRDLYVADLASSSTAARLTFDADIDATPIWSPDGTRIVFRSSRNGVYDLYQKASNFEGTESPLYKSPLPKTPGDWSPDGRHLVFIANGDRETGLDLWVLPMNGGEAAGEARPLVRTAADESQAAFSPDGRWIAYQSNDGGPTEIYVQPFPGPGGKRQVSIGGGASERWRRDGRELFYLSPDEQLMAVPIRTNGPEFEHGPPVALFKTRLSGAFGNIRPQYDVGVDGRFVMNVTAEETNSPITVLLNWKPAESNRQR